MALLTNQSLPPPSDQAGMEMTWEDRSDSLLTRLRRQNGALERLRAALDREAVEIEQADTLRARSARLG